MKLHLVTVMTIKQQLLLILLLLMLIVHYRKLMSYQSAKINKYMQFIKMFQQIPDAATSKINFNATEFTSCK